MAENIKCPKCGADNPKENKFCDTCGYKLVAKKEPIKQPGKPTEKKKVIAEEIVAEPVKEKKEQPVIEKIKEEETITKSGIVIDWEMICWILIIIFTFFTRFYDLGTKPLHHDESMHAFYGWKLFKGEGYQYNPMMHGPFHYHANALIYFLFGTSDYTSRVAPAIFGLIGVLLIWFYKPYIGGKLGGVITAIIMAISPMFMYQARFIREDIFMAVDTIAMVIGLFKFFDTKKPAWLYLASVGLAFSWATKEATYITGFIFFTFFFFRWIWEYSLRHLPEKFQEENKIYGTLNYLFGKGLPVLGWALAIFFGINLVLYTTLFSNPKGFIDAFTASLTYWLGQHGVERGSQPVYYYWLLIPFYEMLPFLFTLIATVYYLLVPEKRTFFNLFTIYWWIMSMIIYSWAGERMPWLSLHPLAPMIILSGKFIAEMIEKIEWGYLRQIGIVTAIILAMGSIHGAFNLCFYGAGASPKESFVYVQSSVDATYVAKKIYNLAVGIKSEKWDSQEFRNFDPYDMEIVVEDYCSWPFAWYLRDFRRVAYPPKDIPSSDVGKPIILSGIEEAAPGHDKRVKELLEPQYVAMRYKLREWWAPDVNKFMRASLRDKITMLWRRFMYREVWNDLGSYDFVVYVRKDLEKYWRD